jgi:glyoxylase-like metal-dependent hydrolase (beta-lactamase superfamily II)
VDREVQDGETLPEVLGGLTVVATPGHAPGHLAFWQPALRLLFCGDVIFRLPNLRLPYSFFTVDMEENKRSIRRVAALEPAIVCFGHGRPLRQNTAAAIHAFAQKVGA